MRKKILHFLVLPLLVSIIVATVLNIAATGYFINQTKKDIMNILFTNNVLHQYFQKVLHPAIYDAMGHGLVDKDFYDPQVLSSTYVVRTMQGLNNEEREKTGRRPIYYKMAANNPRNPFNKADAREARLIKLFNENPSTKEYEEVVTVNGEKYLYYAIPFLRNDIRCMRCHGDPENAPKGLRKLYPGEGGFHERLGEIRAIESLRVPIKLESYMALVLTGSVGSGLFVIVSLFFFNTGLRQQVSQKTKSLTAEILEKEKAQEQLKASSDMIANERERLSVTLRSIGDGVIVTDTEGNITLLNNVGELLTGWSSAEAKGQPLTKVFNIINEATRETCENPTEKVIRTGMIAGLANHTLLIRKDGTEIIISDSGAPIKDMESKTIGVVIVFRDITAQYRTEQEMQKMQKLESLGVLAGGLAHDFNNLLTSIIGNISLTRMSMGIEHKSFERLTEAEKAAERAADLTYQLLTFSKGGAPIKKVASIAEIVEEAVNFALSGSNVNCIYSIPSNLRSVAVDKGQMTQVFNNLIINAIQAMPNGGTVHIALDNISLSEEEIFSLGSGAYVRITFRDEGVGIPEQNLDRIFEPYYTTKEKGNGLGLSTVFSILKRHEGHINVESVIGTGTTFTIYIPALKDSVCHDHEAVGGIKPGKGRILVMDDEPLIRNIGKEILSALGYEVDVTKDGKEAVEAYTKAQNKGKPFDLVIMDLTVPGGMGGKEAAAKLHEFDPDAKVIVSSGYSVDPIMSEYEKYGFSGVINKPYNANQLSEAISKIIGCDK